VQEMKRLIFISAAFLCILSAIAQNNVNEIALVVSPLKLDQTENYQFLYRKSLNNDKMLRIGGRFFAATTKETRSDTVATNFGSVQYDLSGGLQKNLHIDNLDAVYLYAGIDGYWNSEFNRKSYESYYAYYWNFGLKPIAGIAYEPFNNIRLSLESKADFNVNLQDYSAPGINKDKKFSFSPLSQLGLSLGYLF
jgi:hypothetical protein